MHTMTVIVAGLTVLLACLASTLAGYPMGRYSHSLYYSPLPLYYTRPFYYPTPSDSDYYYPSSQEPYYPVYYPGYYQRPYYSYSYDEAGEPIEELPEEVEAGDYGQETWYQDSNADVNARFLQTLILAQIYKDKVGDLEKEGEREEDNSRWVYGEPVKTSKTKNLQKEDEDVRELKNLVQGPAERRERSDKKSRKERKDKNIFAAQTNPEWDQFRSLKADASTSRSNQKRSGSEMAKAPPVGQKEVVLPRPASPVRVPDFQRFTTRSSERQPSVFDTIKKLLHMEEQLDEDKSESESRLQKRSYIPSEESLVAQLGRLKKMA